MSASLTTDFTMIYITNLMILKNADKKLNLPILCMRFYFKSMLNNVFVLFCCFVSFIFLEVLILLVSLFLVFYQANFD